MCEKNTNFLQFHIINSSMGQFQSTEHRVGVYRHLSGKFEDRAGKEMELKNLKLYLENLRIIEENEKLRRKASLLQLEIFSLIAEIQKKVPFLG